MSSPSPAFVDTYCDKVTRSVFLAARYKLGKFQIEEQDRLAQAIPVATAAPWPLLAYNPHPTKGESPMLWVAGQSQFNGSEYNASSRWQGNRLIFLNVDTRASTHRPGWQNAHPLVLTPATKLPSPSSPMTPTVSWSPLPLSRQLAPPVCGANCVPWICELCTPPCKWRGERQLRSLSGQGHNVRRSVV